jgi:hypothetical protein
MEEILIKKIKGGMTAIKTGQKTPKEASLGLAFNKLKEINLPMYEDLLEQYKEILKKQKD